MGYERGPGVRGEEADERAHLVAIRGHPTVTPALPPFPERSGEFIDVYAISSTLLATTGPARPSDSELYPPPLPHSL